MPGTLLPSVVHPADTPHTVTTYIRHPYRSIKGSSSINRGQKFSRAHRLVLIFNKRQTHEFIIYPMRQQARAKILTI